MVSFCLNKNTVMENKQGRCEIVNIREYRPLQKRTDSDTLTKGVLSNILLIL